MSAGGVFQLIANDGKADRMIMASELLNNRIKDIMCIRSRQGLDPTPTLVDLERTHILFVNATFKPFAAIAQEYYRCRVSSGSASFNNEAQFSIPQFGDFFHDMVINATLSQTSATTGTVPPLPDFVTDADNKYIDANGDLQDLAPATVYGKSSGTVDAANGTYTRYVHEYVDAAGNVVPEGAPIKNFVRYCEYPGERLFSKVKFEVTSNPLDEYNSEAVVNYRNFRVAPNKLTGWKRLMGQEVPVEAYSDLSSMAGASNWPATMTNLGANEIESAPTNATVTARKKFTVCNGPQTPKLVQPALDLWIPLLFWFNTDSRLSIPSVSLPHGHRFITVTLEQQNKLLFTAPGNLFLRLTTIQSINTGNDASSGTAAAIAVKEVKRWVRTEPVLVPDSVIDSTQTITNFDLYINNLFMNTEIHDIWMKRIGFSLIRVHRQQEIDQTTSTGQILLSSMKWPIETLFVGARPLHNVSPSNPNQYRDWHRMELLTDQSLDTVSRAYGDVMINDIDAFNANGSSHRNTFSQDLAERITFPTFTPTIDTLQVVVQGINVFNAYKSQFFNSYLPFRFGGHNLNVPEDTGRMMINFNLYPGTYQPSGHLNVSRAREFYVHYTSSFASTSTPVKFMFMAVAINFLLISDGSAVLRYTT